MLLRPITIILIPIYTYVYFYVIGGNGLDLCINCDGFFFFPFMDEIELGWNLVYWLTHDVIFLVFHLVDAYILLAQTPVLNYKITKGN